MQLSGHLFTPQSTMVPGHLGSVTAPQVAPSSSQVEGVQVPPSGIVFVPMPQRFGSTPPQTSPAPQVPHSMTPPHLVSVTKPQLAFSSSHVEGQPLEVPPSPRVKLPPVAPLPLPALASGMNKSLLLTTS